MDRAGVIDNLWQERFPEAAALSAAIGGAGTSSRYDAARQLFRWLMTDMDGQSFLAEALDKLTDQHAPSPAVSTSNLGARKATVDDDLNELTLAAAIEIYPNIADAKTDALTRDLNSQGGDWRSITANQHTIRGCVDARTQTVGFLSTGALFGIAQFIWGNDSCINLYLRNHVPDVEFIDYQGKNDAAVILAKLTFDDFQPGEAQRVYRVSLLDFIRLTNLA